MLKKLLLAVFISLCVHIDTGSAQGADFPNVLDKGGIQILCKSGAAVSAPADTNEDTLATCNVPANAMGASGVLRVDTFWAITNSANSKTLRVRYSGASGTTYQSVALTTNDAARLYTVIFNRAATNSQVGGISGSGAPFGATNVVTTSSVDTTAATSIVITCQKVTGAETCTLHSYLVEILPSN